MGWFELVVFLEIFFLKFDGYDLRMENGNK